jgi:hypothetical protein
MRLSRGVVTSDMYEGITIVKTRDLSDAIFFCISQPLNFYTNSQFLIYLNNNTPTSSISI